MSTIKNLRKSNRISQVALAEYLGVTQGFVSQMEKEICPTPHWVISKLLENSYNWDVSMLAPSKEEIPAEEQRQPDTLDRLFAIVEEQRKDIATLLAMMKDKDEKIEEMRRELDSLKRGVAQSAVGSSGANVG